MLKCSKWRVCIQLDLAGEPDCLPARGLSEQSNLKIELFGLDGEPVLVGSNRERFLHMELKMKD